MKIWFHGTTEIASRYIVVDGFRAGSWFSRSLEDAIGFGGMHVFEVALDFEPVSDGAWQMRVPEAVPEDRIVSLNYYIRHPLVEYPDRRKAVLASNTK